MSAVDQVIEPVYLDFSPYELVLDPHLEIAPTKCRRGQAHERPFFSDPSSHGSSRSRCPARCDPSSRLWPQGSAYRQVVRRQDPDEQQAPVQPDADACDAPEVHGVRHGWLRRASGMTSMTRIHKVTPAMSAETASR